MTTRARSAKPAPTAPADSTAAKRARTPAPAPARGGALAARLARGDLFAEACPSREVMRHVTSRWGVLVLLALKGGTHRFSELRRKVQGVSEKMLAQTLQWLESDGLVRRVSYPVVPPHVEYSLTPLGEEVAVRVEDLADWIEANLPRVLAAQKAQPAA